MARWLRELGHRVIVADPNFAPLYATRSRKVKTNRRDARALCDACRLGAVAGQRTTLRTGPVIGERRSRCVMRWCARERSTSRWRGRACAARGRAPRSGGAATLDAHRGAVTARPPGARGRAAAHDARAAHHADPQHDEHPGRAVRQGRRDRRTPVHRAEHRAGDGGDLRRRGRPDGSGAERLRGLPLPSAGYRELVVCRDRMRGRVAKTGNRRLRSLLVEAAWGNTEVTNDQRSRRSRRTGRSASPHAAASGSRRWRWRASSRGILYAMWRDGTRFEATSQSREEAAAA